MSQGLSPLPKPCYSQQLAMPPDPGSCLVAGFPPCPQRGSMMSPPPSASPKLHDLSSAPYSKGMASPGHSHLGLQRPAGGVLAVQEAPRPVGVHPGSPQQPPPALLQPQVSPQLSSSCSLGRQPALCPNSSSSPLPSGTQEPTCLQSCSPTRPSVMGHQQHPPPKVPRNESAATQPLPLPEVREDSNHSLAPIPVTVKREPQELDQLYLDDGKSPRRRCAFSLAPYPRVQEEGCLCMRVCAGSTSCCCWRRCVVTVSAASQPRDARLCSVTLVPAMSVSVDPQGTLSGPYRPESQHAPVCWPQVQTVLPGASWEFCHKRLPGSVAAGYAVLFLGILRASLVERTIFEQLLS